MEAPDGAESFSRTRRVVDTGNSAVAAGASGGLSSPEERKHAQEPRWHEHRLKPFAKLLIPASAFPWST